MTPGRTLALALGCSTGTSTVAVALRTDAGCPQDAGGRVLSTGL